MPATYEPIASVTLTTGTNTVTFSSIPQTFTDLVGVWSLRSSANGPFNQIRIGINGQSNIYSRTTLFGDGSTASSSRYANMPGLLEPQGFIVPASGPANSYAIQVWDFMSYSNTNVFKTALSREHYDGTMPSRNVYLIRTTSAITQISVGAAGGSDSLVAGSTISLYGIKASA